MGTIENNPGQPEDPDYDEATVATAVKLIDAAVRTQIELADDLAAIRINIADVWEAVDRLRKIAAAEPLPAGSRKDQEVSDYALALDPVLIGVGFATDAIDALGELVEQRENLDLNDDAELARRLDDQIEKVIGELDGVRQDMAEAFVKERLQ
jgi:hypothetical protein